MLVHPSMLASTSSNVGPALYGVHGLDLIQLCSHSMIVSYYSKVMARQERRSTNTFTDL